MSALDDDIAAILAEAGEAERVAHEYAAKLAALRSEHAAKVVELRKWLYANAPGNRHHHSAAYKQRRLSS